MNQLASCASAAQFHTSTRELVMSSRPCLSLWPCFPPAAALNPAGAQHSLEHLAQCPHHIYILSTSTRD